MGGGQGNHILLLLSPRSGYPFYIKYKMDNYFLDIQYKPWLRYRDSIEWKGWQLQFCTEQFYFTKQLEVLCVQEVVTHFI